MTESIPIDPEAIERINRIGGPDLVVRMIGVFLDFIPDHLQTIENAKKEEDWESAAKSAHAMKSSAGNVGANSLFDLLDRIERKAANQECEGIAELINELRPLYEKTRKCLLEIQKGLSE